MPPKISSPDVRRAHFIKEWRKHRGLTQQQLADRLSTTKQSISRIEKGDQPYTQESLEALAGVLQCSPADLISRDPAQEVDLPIFDLPDSDQARVREFVRALRTTRERDDGSTPADIPDTIPAAKPAKRVTRKRA